MELSRDEIQSAVVAALAEDLGVGDATTLATVPVEATTCAVMRARESLVVAGLAFAEAAFSRLSSTVTITRCKGDGERIKAGEDLLKIEGPTRAILSGERVALNFVQRLSGIATLTA